MPVNRLDLEQYEIPEKDGVVLPRRNVLKLILGAGAGALATSLDPHSAEADTPPSSDIWAAGYYNRLRQRIKDELNAGETALGDELADALGEFPRYYYEHDATKITDAQGNNVPSPSIAFEVIKEAWFNMKGEVATATGREISLDKLRLAAQPGIPIQQRLLNVFKNNYAGNRQLKPYWEVLQADTFALVKDVQSLVLKERAAARRLKTPSSAQGIIRPADVIPLSRKNPALKKKHDEERDDYEDIETWLRPAAYQCDQVSAALNSRPSGIIEVEAIKTLKVVAQQHLLAAVQRKEAYHAIQSFVQKSGSKARPLLKYDGTRQNDPILYGWLELLREKVDEDGQKGQIPALLDRVVAVVQGQANFAEKIKRCVG